MAAVGSAAVDWQAVASLLYDPNALPHATPLLNALPLPLPLNALAPLPPDQPTERVNADDAAPEESHRLLPLRASLTPLASVPQQLLVPDADSRAAVPLFGVALRREAIACVRKECCFRAMQSRKSVSRGMVSSSLSSSSSTGLARGLQGRAADTAREKGMGTGAAADVEAAGSTWPWFPITWAVEQPGCRWFGCDGRAADKTCVQQLGSHASSEPTTAVWRSIEFACAGRIRSRHGHDVATVHAMCTRMRNLVQALCEAGHSHNRLFTSTAVWAYTLESAHKMGAGPS